MKLARRSLLRGVCGALLGRAVGVEKAAKVIGAADTAYEWAVQTWVRGAEVIEIRVERK